MKGIDNRQSEKGLSLLEIAIALIVVGLLITPLLQMYNINKMERISRENNKGLENIAIALNKYAQQNKRYPVPANPTLTSSATDYGSSATISPSATCDGIIAGQGVRCTTGAASITSPLNEVLVGTVPFLELGLNEKDIFDTYGSRITYAVTRRLTDPTIVNGTTQFNDKEGAIGLVNQKGDPLNGSDDFNTQDSTGKSRVLFALINHGPNRSGAYQKDGSLAACSGQLDTDNCNRDATIPNGSNADGVFRGMQKYDPANAPDGLLPELSKHFALGSGTDSYDDTVIFRTTSRNEGWSSLRDDEDDAEAGTFLSDAGKVMIKDPIAAMTPKAAMDVDGAVQVYKAMSKTICNTGSTDEPENCFRVDNIAAAEPDPTQLEGGLDKSVKCNDTTGLIRFEKKDATQNGGQLDVTDHRPQSKHYIKRNCPPTSSTITQRNCPNGISGISGGVPVCM